MNEYINLARARFEAKRYFKNMEEIQEDLDMLFCMLPSEDVAPVRHGRWILDEKRYVIYCSECSAPVSYYPNIKDVREENHYCPNCGCKMDLEG